MSTRRQDDGDNDPDDGLSNERTALSWQRTALATAGGAAVVARLTVDRVGVAALAVLGLALVLGLWLFAESWWRYAHHAGVRHRPGPRGGLAPAVLTVAVGLIGVTELVALTTR